ncbi:hypothetical protein L596_028839 [Steinernema carpocapsae]|uniref:Uncharacterized protein n=1 Tax=Steinernema carpocapsae TaxID=34508 RepID=A0A4U5LZI8_STECR|nr:hypothetical protein L596_028839 [Steinernema carpocapsae]
MSSTLISSRLLYDMLGTEVGYRYPGFTVNIYFAYFQVLLFLSLIIYIMDSVLGCIIACKGSNQGFNQQGYPQGPNAGFNQQGFLGNLEMANQNGGNSANPGMNNPQAANPSFAPQRTIASSGTKAQETAEIPWFESLLYARVRVLNKANFGCAMR